MKKSVMSIIALNRRVILFLGVVLSLGALSVATWQTSAQNSASEDKESRSVTDRERNDGAMLSQPTTIRYTGPAVKTSDITATPLVPTVGIDQGEEIEPNGTIATATFLSGNEVKITGNVYPNADVDYYRLPLTVAAGDRIYAAVMGSYSASASNDSQLRIVDSSDTVLEFDDDDGSLGSLSSTIAGFVIPGSGGPFYLKVQHFSLTNTLRPYELYVRVQTGSPTPEVEANDTPATANPLPPSGWVSGARNPAVATEQDWFSMTLNAGDTVYLGLDLDPERDNVQWNGRLGLALFGDANNQILVIDDASVGSVANPLSEAYFMTVKTAGTYYAFVDSATAATGGPTATYNLSVAVIPRVPVGVNCTTYTSTNVPLPITDAALTSSTITVPGHARIASARVSINATHTLMADLDVNLRSPAGNNNGLFNDIGAAAVGGQTMMDITLDQYSAGVPFVFTVLRPLVLKPELAYRLDWLVGEDAGGVWTLDIRDDLTNATTGTLNSWSLEICQQTPNGSIIYDENFESGNGGYTLGTVGQLANEWQYGTPNNPGTTTANPVAPFIGCNSGVSCWKTDLVGTYEISSNQDLVSPNIVLPSTMGTLNLQWAMKYQMESTTFDHLRVSVAEVGMPTNTRVLWEWKGATMTTAVGTPVVNIGGSAGWGNYRANITDFAGKTVQFTFHVDTDTSINFAGVGIDDVQVRLVPGVRSPADFDGDGKSDLSVFRSGTWFIERSTAGALTQAFGLSTDKIVPGDFDGDAKADIAVFRENADPSMNFWYVLESSTVTLQVQEWGQMGDLPQLGDYDGDGCTDFALFRPSTSEWWILRSSDGVSTAGVWGQSGDVPVVGDFDGDQKADLTVFRPASANWFVLRSSNGMALTQQFGLTGDKLVPGDYNGDGTTDFAVFRPSTNTWFTSLSPATNYGATVWGAAGDIVVPGDYDGDARTDVAVFRPSTGTWHIRRSGSTPTTAIFGTSGDLPVPNVFTR